MEVQPFPEGSTVRHGTPSGASLHVQLGQPACDACARAKREYDQNLRSAPEAKILNRLRARAQHRAYRFLAKKYYDEYREVYQRFKSEAEEEFFKDYGA